jgi:AcrR family transcriptional regulator
MLIPDSENVHRRVGMARAKFRNSPGAVGEHGLKRKQEILDTARLYLEVTPWRKASTVDIARLSNCSHATIYQYFPDIDEILHEVIAEMNRNNEKIPEHLQLIWDLLQYEEGQSLG